VFSSDLGQNVNPQSHSPLENSIDRYAVLTSSTGDMQIDEEVFMVLETSLSPRQKSKDKYSYVHEHYWAVLILIEFAARVPAR